jgi:hypothetical protein
VGEGKQPDCSIESALWYMEEYDIAACMLSAPAVRASISKEGVKTNPQGVPQNPADAPCLQTEE